MGQNDPLNHGQIVHEGFFDPIQELLGAHIGAGFKLERLNTTTVKVVAATEDGQVSIAVKGRYRWRTTETTAVLPGGLPTGEHPVFVTASDNDYTGPIEDPDSPTVYTFGLEIKEAGKVPATALYREIGKVQVEGGVIKWVRQTAGATIGAQMDNAWASSTEGDITWTRDVNGAWIPTVKSKAVTLAKLDEETQNMLKAAGGYGKNFWSAAELTRANAAFGSFSTPILTTIPKVKANQVLELHLIAFVQKIEGVTTLRVTVEGTAVTPEFAMPGTVGSWQTIHFGVTGALQQGTEYVAGEIGAVVSLVEAGYTVPTATVNHAPLVMKAPNSEKSNVAVELQAKHSTAGTIKVKGAWLAACPRG